MIELLGRGFVRVPVQRQRQQPTARTQYARSFAHRDGGLFGPRLAVTTSGMVGVVNSVVAAAGVGLVAASLTRSTPLSAVLAVGAFAVSNAILLGLTSRAYAQAQRDLDPRFPTPPAG